MQTGFVHHESTYWHDTGNGGGFMEATFPVQPGWPAEHPETKRRFKNLLELSPLWDSLKIIRPRPATEAEILRFHTPRYLEKVRDLSTSPFGGDAGELARIGGGTFEIALMSAGMAITAADAVIRGDCRTAYSLSRPPGHHADADLGRGFCIFGNIVIAAKHCQEVHKVGRIAVVDFDVHHGNGTETAFYGANDVLTISLHQDNMYPPDRGKIADVVEGAGRGYNINVPLPPGSGTGAYMAAFDEVVLPALERYRPDAIFVASGFDACYYDPLGRMMLYSKDYFDITKKLQAAADQLCNGRMIFIHEGGYSIFYVPFCGMAVMEALTGISSGFDDPFKGFPETATYRDVQPHQRAVIDAARESAQGFWTSW